VFFCFQVLQREDAKSKQEGETKMGPLGVAGASIKGNFEFNLL
jgi:hypothetical protein